MNPFEMVVAIIVIVTIGSVIKARFGIHRDASGNDVYHGGTDAETIAENARLKEELRAIKERVQVLERVITDTDSSVRLDREIESLRDRK